MRKTKIIVTLGPSTSGLETLVKLIREGVDGFRLNFSHGDKDTWLNWIRILRKAEEITGKETALIGDLTGSGIRIGETSERWVEKGSILFVENSERSEENIPLPSKKAYDSIEEGDLLLIDDGKLRLRVIEILMDKVKVEALNSAEISSRKSFTISGKDLKLPPLTEKDIRDIEFSIKVGVDFLALSFTRSAEDVMVLRECLNKLRAEKIGVLAKIETKGGVKNIEAISSEADGVIVARGDLGMHFNLEEIPKLQRRIIRSALRNRRIAIVATQLLESMIDSSTPTRSEVTDVMTIVHEGIDALMLTSETAVGRYPIEASRWLRRIIEAAEEERVEFDRWISDELPIRFAYGVVSLSESLGAKIVVYTMEGKTARRMASFRPKVPIYASSSSDRVRRKLMITWGVKPIRVEAKSYDEGLEKSFKKLKELGEIGYGDIVVLTYGIREGTTHAVKIQQVI